MTREEAINILKNDEGYDVISPDAREAIGMAIRSLETENVIEIVRCRDCRWNYIHVTPKGNDYHICKLLNLAFDNDDNFFCAYGEKKSESGEPIPQWRGCYDGTIPYFDGKEAKDEQIH